MSKTLILEHFAGSACVKPVDMHRAMKRGLRVTANTVDIEAADSRMFGLNSSIQLDWATWLPFAAKKYHISPNVEDYVLMPVLTIPTDLPNRNGVGFPLKQLLEFNNEYGMQAYKTFKAKPTHIEHQNDDITQAKGVIVDTFLRKMVNVDGIWKLLELLSFDRTKDRELCKDILSGDMNSYSMGAWVEGYQCSICDAEIGKCSHLHPQAPLDFYRFGKELCFRKVVKPVGFETSAVKTPAYVTAVSDILHPINPELRERPRDLGLTRVSVSRS